MSCLKQKIVGDAAFLYRLVNVRNMNAEGRALVSHTLARQIAIGGKQTRALLPASVIAGRELPHMRSASLGGCHEKTVSVREVA